nr:hypothetical protein [Bacillus safensis]
MKKSVWMIMICLIFTASACHAPPKKETTEETSEVSAHKQAPVTTSLINESGQKIGSIEIRESSENGLDLHVKAKGCRQVLTVFIFMKQEYVKRQILKRQELTLIQPIESMVLTIQRGTMLEICLI